MARIFRTEQLEINGNIRLSTEGTAGVFEIQSASGSTLHMSKASIENDISSLAAKNAALDASIETDETSNNTVQASILTEKNSDDQIATKVGNRHAKDILLDGDMQSHENADGNVAQGILTEKNSDDTMADAILAAKNADDGLDNDVSGLEDANVVMNSEISSLASAISDNDVVAKSESANEDDETATIAFGRTFSGTPAVVASLRSSTASDPVIPVMVTSVSTTNCTVSFGDGLPSDDYTVEVLASEV